MATAPAFAATVNNLPVKVSATADTSYTAPSTTVVCFTAGASGSQITEIDINGNGTTVLGVINLFIKRSATFYLFDSVAIPVVTPSTTAVNLRIARTYSNLVLKSGDTLEATSTVTNQLASVCAFGGDF
jgi:hypothetical protein